MPNKPDRRWRLDPLARQAEAADGAEAGPEPAADPNPPRPGGSGRLAVVALVLAVLTLWGGLELAFRAWKGRYEARAALGARKLAPAVDPLDRLTPPDVDPATWARAVADTHAMLLALAGSGVLDETRIEALHRRIAAEVAAARPETARATLAALWDDLQRQAGPVIAPDLAPPPPNSRHAARHPRPPRPAILGPGPRPPTDRPEG